MEKFYQLKQELLVMKTNNIKPNYSILVSKVSANNNDIPLENDLLNEDGVWLVVTE